jgi:putative ABC transport system permease protein
MISERIFRALLRLYPRDFRERFGDEMVEFFHERRLEHDRQGRSMLRLWMHLITDVALSAPMMRLRVAPQHESETALATDASSAPIRGPRVPWSEPEYPAETRPMQTLWQDLKYGARALARRPGFTLVASLTLALGIGATTAIYSVADAVLIQPLPWPDADRLVTINGFRDGQQQGVVFLDYLDWRASNHTFSQLGVFRPQSVNLTGGDQPERITGTFANAEALRMLGASVSQGRLMSDAETDVNGTQPVAVLADGFWRSHYAGSADAIGKTIVLNGQPLTIVGVLKPSFQSPFGQVDAWMPIGYYPNKGDLTTRGRPGVGVFGRLKAGVTLAQAQQDISAISARLAEQFPANAGAGVQLIALKESIVGSSRVQVYLVMGAVVMVLLIACANVANLQLARAASRRHELSVRSALGAGRSRLLRHLMTESLLLAVLGGAIGLAVAYAGVQWLGTSVPNFLQFFGTIKLNPTVLAFAALITLGTGFFFALPPAWRSSRVRLSDALGVRSAIGGGSRSIVGRGGLLIFAQTALCVVLLVTAGLLSRSLIALTRVNPGFDAENVLTMQFRLPAAKYDTEEKIAAMFTRSLDELRAIPGVQSAALVRATPLNGNGEQFPYQLDGVGTTDPKKLPLLHLNLVSPGYYQTMHIAKLAGRDFDANDRAGSEPVVIVNQQLASKIAPAGSPIGKRIKLPDGPQMKWFTIVGVVGNAKHFAVGEHQLDQAYLPYTQRPLIFTEAVLRVNGDPATFGNKAREAVWRVDRDQPVWRVRPLTLSIGNALGGRMFMLRLLAAFAGLAVLLALIGIYGVTSYAVAGRTQEMGIRMALGARAQEVVRLVVRQSMRTIALAIVVGLIGAAAGARFIETLLYGVRPTDPVVYAAVPLGLALVALVACWLPARRASRVDPVATLRAD